MVVSDADDLDAGRKHPSLKIPKTEYEVNLLPS